MTSGIELAQAQPCHPAQRLRFKKLVDWPQQHKLVPRRGT
jgi:hypothetical protein